MILSFWGTACFEGRTVGSGRVQYKQTLLKYEHFGLEHVPSLVNMATEILHLFIGDTSSKGPLSVAMLSY